MSSSDGGPLLAEGDGAGQCGVLLRQYESCRAELVYEKEASLIADLQAGRNQQTGGLNLTTLSPSEEWVASEEELLQQDAP